MISVHRLPLPSEAEKELQQRQQRLVGCPPRDEKVDSEWNRLYGTDLRDTMVRTLEQQHHYKCVYCDTTGCANTIEHYYPKKQFPELALDWLNLSLACGTCQTYKGEPLEFQSVWPRILDPVQEEIRDFVYISPQDGRMTPALKLDTQQIDYARAKETIRRLRLNERGLPNVRMAVALELRTALESFRANPCKETKQKVLDKQSDDRSWLAVALQIMADPDSEYVSLVAFWNEHAGCCA